MRPIHEIIFELQNMHFNFRGDFTWNVRKFQPALERFLAEAREEGRRAGRLEVQHEVGKNMCHTPSPERGIMEP